MAVNEREREWEILGNLFRIFAWAALKKLKADVSTMDWQSSTIALCHVILCPTTATEIKGSAKNFANIRNCWWALGNFEFKQLRFLVTTTA